MLIFDPATDPAFNLAAEEFLLREVSEPVLRIWRNSPCVVIGRHQIPCVEADVVAAWRRGVPIFRRLSGGGAVYHDLGNVNFTMILPAEKGRGMDFERMLAPVVAALKAMGVDATYAGRGDLRLDGRKISGNSAYLWKGRVLHHGTLLFAADIETLDALLEVRGDGVAGKSVRSVRSAVSNIRDALPGYADAWTFAADFMKTLAQTLVMDPAFARVLSPDEKSRISEIARTMYSTPEWNLGSSPDYSLERCDENGHTIKIVVKDGKINAVEAADYEDFACELRAAMSGVWHEPASIEAALANTKPECRLPVETFF